MPDEVIVIRVRGEGEDAERDLRELVSLLKRMGEQAKRTGRDTQRGEQTAQRAIDRTTTAERNKARATRTSEQASRRSEQTNRRLSRSQDMVNTRLRSAAKYAAGAAAGYIGISQARDAVTTTTDLAKATLTLTKNLGLGTRTASEFSALAFTRGADARSLGMAFNTLSGQVRGARNESKSSIKIFEGLGISLEELRRSSPEEMLFKVSDGLEEMGTGFARTDAQRKLFGRGAATLTPLLRSGSDELQAQLSDARELGATFSKLGLEDMEDVIAAQRRMKLAQMGLQISFTQTLAPAIEAVTGELADMGKTLNDPTLSSDEKMDAIAERFSELLTQLAAESTERAPMVAAAFIKGFVQAPIWGQALIGGAILAKFGGGFGALGTKAGRSWGLAFIGALLALQLGKEIKQIIEGHELGSSSREAFAAKDLGQFGFDTDQIQFKGKDKVAVATEFGDLIFNATTKKIVAAKGKELQDLVGKTASAAATKLNALARAPQARRDLDSLAKMVGTRMGRISGVTDRELKKVRQSMKDNPEQGRQALSATYSKMIANIEQAMQSGKVSTEQGMAKIREITTSNLELYGITSPGDAITAAAQAIAKKVAPAAKGGKKGPGAQTGAMLVPGTGSGDKVAVQAMVEPDEALAVLNRNAAKAWMAWNEQYPRFAKGGMALPTYTGNYPTGQVAADALNLTSGAAGDLVDKARRAQQAARAARQGAGGSYTGPPANMAQLGQAGWVDKHTYAVANYLANRFGSSISSDWRSKAENDAANGSPTSSHMRGTAANPGAFDFVPPSQAMQAFVSSSIAGVTENDIHDYGSGLHNHIAFFQRGGMLGFKRGGVSVPSRPLRGDHWVKGSDPGSERGRLWSTDEWATLLWQVGGSQGEAESLSTKLMSESAGNPKAHGPPDGRGLGQIEKQFHPELAHLALFNPIPNAVASLHVLRKQGLGAWYGASGAAGKVRRDLVAGTKKPATKPGKKGKKTKTPAAASTASSADASTLSSDMAASQYAEYLATLTEANRYYSADRALSMRLTPVVAGFAKREGIGLYGPYADVPLPPVPPAFASAASSMPAGGSTPATVPSSASGLKGRARPDRKRRKGDKTGGVSPVQITIKGDIDKHLKYEVNRGITRSDRRLGRKARRISYSPG